MYILAFREGRKGCIALQSDYGPTADALVEYLSRKVYNRNIRIKMVSGFRSDGEHAPYAKVLDETEFITRVLDGHIVESDRPSEPSPLEVRLLEEYYACEKKYIAMAQDSRERWKKSLSELEHNIRILRRVLDPAMIEFYRNRAEEPAE